MDRLYILILLVSLFINCSFGKICNEDLHPECGIVPSRGPQHDVGREPAAGRADVPWHAGVYSKMSEPYQQICGGSLISNNIVLSSANCFWSELESKQLPAAEFAVAVGKLHRPWSYGEDSAQRSDVKAIHLPILFRGSRTRYQEDIAVVEVSMPFQFTAFVRPVRLDFDYAFQNTHLKVGNMGKVAVWGAAVNGTSSQALKVMDLPFVSIETCINDTSFLFRRYITSDKFCAGFKNEHKPVLRGDIGGGLTFPEWDGGPPRFYLRGILSTAPNSDDTTNANVYMTFTEILKHEHFIKQFWENEESTRAAETAAPPPGGTAARNPVQPLYDSEIHNTQYPCC